MIYLLPGRFVEMRKIRIFSAIGMLCLLVFNGCGDQNGEDKDECPGEPAECRLAEEGLFSIRSPDLSWGEISCIELDATLIEMPSTRNSENLILRDAQGNDYRFEPLYDDLGWAKQLDGLQVGKTYHFVFAFNIGSPEIYGMRILDKGSLLYLAERTSVGGYSVFDWCNPRTTVNLNRTTFGGTELEGFTVDQLSESPCCARKESDGYGGISLVTSVPMLFQYGDQTATLYQSQEAVFTTPYGDFLVHVLWSTSDEPLNYENGGGGYSFYAKRL